MARLIVRNLPRDLVRALKQRAARHGRSAEQEHREILEAALRGPRYRLSAAIEARPTPNDYGSGQGIVCVGILGLYQKRGDLRGASSVPHRAVCRRCIR